MSQETALQVERLIEVGRYSAALQLLRPAFSSSPNDPELHCFAARASFGLEKLADAETHLRQALAAQPRHLMARVLWFVLKKQQKRPREAEDAILDVLREYPENADFLSMYAELMLTNLQLDKARALAAEALRREPDNERAQVVNVLLRVVDGDDRGASQLLESLVQSSPDELGTVRALYVVLVTRGRHREALEVGRQLLLLIPHNPELVDALIELRAATHWSTLPLYPTTRWGWAGSGVIWLVAVVGLRAISSQFGEKIGGIASVTFLAYVIYSWVYPPLLKRWLRWRGI